MVSGRSQLKKRFFYSFILLFSLISTLAITAKGSGYERLQKKNSRPLRLNLSREPATMDPRKASDLATSCFTYFLYEGLTRTLPNQVGALGIARKVYKEENGKRYRFLLRHACWSDGQPVTAYDFERSWKELLDPSFFCPNIHLFHPIKGAIEAKAGKLPIEEVGIYAVNDHEFVVELENPTPYFLELVSFCAFFPYRSQNEGQLIVNGPYQLKEHLRGEEILLEKNSLYWDEESVRLKEILCTFIEDEMTAFILYEKGSIDFLGSPYGRIPSDAISFLRQENRLCTGDIPASSYLVFNTGKSPMSNRKFRRALSMAIDRQSLVQNLTLLGELPAFDFVPPLLKGGDQDFLFGNESLDEALHEFFEALHEMELSPTEIRLTLTYSNAQRFSKIAQILQERWESVFKIRVSLEEIEPTLFLDRIYSKNFDLALQNMFAQYIDPLSILDRFYLKNQPKNVAGWQHAEYSHLIEQSFLAENEEKRRELLRKLEEILAFEMPIAPLFHMKSCFLIRESVEQVQMLPQGTFFFNEVTFSS